MNKSERRKSPRSDRTKPAELTPDPPPADGIVDASELVFAWWPSSFFPMPIWPELKETFAHLFRRAHRTLTMNGFLVVDDPYNETRDGRIWRLRCKPTSKLLKGTMPAELLRQCLEKEGVQVQAIEAKGGALHVYLNPPATLEDYLSQAWIRAKESVPVETKPVAHKVSGIVSGRGKRKPYPLRNMRDAVMFAAISRGLRGLRYCRFIQEHKISPPPDWVSAGCPKTYPEAHEVGQPWQKRIQDEKHRASVRMQYMEQRDPKYLEALLSRYK